nr:MAG TPA: hypothetical protein [Caudoviricetes sp.]
MGRLGGCNKARSQLLYTTIPRPAIVKIYNVNKSKCACIMCKRVKAACCSHAARY